MIHNSNVRLKDILIGGSFSIYQKIVLSELNALYCLLGNFSSLIFVEMEFKFSFEKGNLAKRSFNVTLLAVSTVNIVISWRNFHLYWIDESIDKQIFAIVVNIHFLNNKSQCFEKRRFDINSQFLDLNWEISKIESRGLLLMDSTLLYQRNLHNRFFIFVLVDFIIAYFQGSLKSSSTCFLILFKVNIS